MFQERCYDRENDINNTFFAENMTNNIDMDQNNFQGMNTSQQMMGSVGQTLYEPMQERVVNRTFVHEVPHVCPMRTRIINHHIFRHTYRPEYSCCEQNVVSQEQCGSCCNFR